MKGIIAIKGDDTEMVNKVINVISYIKIAGLASASYDKYVASKLVYSHYNNEFIVRREDVELEIFNYMYSLDIEGLKDPRLEQYYCLNDGSILEPRSITNYNKILSAESLYDFNNIFDTYGTDFDITVIKLRHLYDALVRFNNISNLGKYRLYNKVINKAMITTANKNLSIVVVNDEYVMLNILKSKFLYGGFLEVLSCEIPSVAIVDKRPEDDTLIIDRINMSSFYIIKKWYEDVYYNFKKVKGRNL